MKIPCPHTIVLRMLHVPGFYLDLPALTYICTVFHIAYVEDMCHKLKKFQNCVSVLVVVYQLQLATSFSPPISLCWVFSSSPFVHFVCQSFLVMQMSADHIDSCTQYCSPTDEKWSTSDEWSLFCVVLMMLMQLLGCRINSFSVCVCVCVCV